LEVDTLNSELAALRAKIVTVEEYNNTELENESNKDNEN